MKLHKALMLVAAVFTLSACGSKQDLMSMDQWDLVWISDSSGWGVAKIYAQMVEEDTGIPVVVHDNWQGGLAIGAVLHAMQGTPTPSMTLRNNADLIRDAEIVVIYGNPTESVNASNPGEWNCTSSGGNFVNSCDPEIFSVYIDDFKAVYQMIFDLRGGQPTIVRTFDAYNPYINEFKDQGVYQDCRDCWGKYNAAIHNAAAAFNVPVAAAAEAWNGPNWDQDPSDIGYERDGAHPSDLGATAIAQAIRETGYDPVER